MLIFEFLMTVLHNYDRESFSCLFLLSSFLPTYRPFFLPTIPISPILLFFHLFYSFLLLSFLPCFIPSSLPRLPSFLLFYLPFFPSLTSFLSSFLPSLSSFLDFLHFFFPTSHFFLPLLPSYLLFYLLFLLSLTSFLPTIRISYLRNILSQF